MSGNFGLMEPQHGIGAVLASPKGQYFPFSARLGFDCPNNMAKYEACAMGITMAIEHQISKLKVFGQKPNGRCSGNPVAMLQENQNKEMTIHVQYQTKMAHCQQVEEAGIDGKPWYHDIRGYLNKGAYPARATENDKRTLRRLATRFFLSGILYKRSADLTLLRCVDD
ncbi:hypothetical protein CR513_59600, partial [Mucuna pruriens]